MVLNRFLIGLEVVIILNLKKAGVAIATPVCLNLKKFKPE
jgi:hypothetical protein